MRGFADRTGLLSASEIHGAGHRYLWTDAFAVCNFLGLADATGDSSYRILALRLVDRVHHDLGRHRKDDARTGWISDLSEEEGEAHPTIGGLRIGKPLPERGPAEPFDPDLEWERDGQYFHYLTKWAHALNRTARSTGRSIHHLWARELMQTAYGSFTQGDPDAPRMVWKLSIDLMTPLVPSMGQHDPLDGFVTCIDLQASAAELRTETVGPSLEQAAAGFAGMIAARSLATSDPLGLGGLLVDACRLADAAPESHDLIAALLVASASGLRELCDTRALSEPPNRRLAFRELGLAIGLEGIATLRQNGGFECLDARCRALATTLAPYVPLSREIESFWC
ncbi:MAG: hypothetical protein ACRELY_23185, partial [Polyangiaceae bacterium]